MEIQVLRDVRAPDVVEAILRDLTEWFGIEDALLDYVDQAQSLPTYAAVVDEKTVGVCLVKHHSPHSAEVYLLAVERRYHRCGAGRMLMSAVEEHLIGTGREFLQVKTLGPSRPSQGYEATRLFYEALGFRALEEFDADTLWPGNPCLVMVKYLRPG